MLILNNSVMEKGRIASFSLFYKPGMGHDFKSNFRLTLSCLRTSGLIRKTVSSYSTNNFCKRIFTELTNKMQSAFKSSQFIITVSMNTAILVVEELEAAEGFGSMVNWTSSFLPWQSSKGFRKWLEMLCVKFRELFENKRASFGSSTERCERRSKSLDLREVFRKLSKLFYLRCFLLRQVLNNRNEYTRWWIFLCVDATLKS